MVPIQKICRQYYSRESEHVHLARDLIFSKESSQLFIVFISFVSKAASSTELILLWNLSYSMNSFLAFTDYGCLSFMMESLHIFWLLMDTPVCTFQNDEVKMIAAVSMAHRNTDLGIFSTFNSIFSCHSLLVLMLNI